MADVTLHLCTTCRKGALPSGVASVSELAAAARRWGRERAVAGAGISVTIARTACLSGCDVGLMAMVETPAGMVRLCRIASGAQIAGALAAREALIEGRPVVALVGHVLSRVAWDEQDADMTSES